MDANNKLQTQVALIMAGGSGSRFWPLSQKHFPKQYLKFAGDKSLIEQTVDRALRFCSNNDIFISSAKSQEALLKKHLSTVSNFILEPIQKNTAACLMLSVVELLRRGYPEETPMMVFPADHTISNLSEFETTIKKAVAFSLTQPSLITIGITPTSPHTGYGYIEASSKEAGPGVFAVNRFTEKPALELARQFISQPNFFWNGGIFVWTLQSIVQAFETFLEPYWSQILHCKGEEELLRIFSELPSLPIDKAILEKARNVFVIPATHLGWSDLGSWGALYDLHAKKPGANVFLGGQTKQLDSRNCLVHTSSETQVALIGLDNIVVVEHQGTILIMDKTQDQKVKDISLLFEA